MTRTRSIWKGMIRRCYDTKSKNYQGYGARGITVCDRWRHSFDAFLADMGECPDGMSIERKNNNGNYEPSNCKWATKKEQNRNTRNNRLVTFRGETQPVSVFAERHGIPSRIVFARLHIGWSVEDALTVPPAKRGTRTKTALSPEQIETARRMRQAGETFQSISKAIGSTTTRVFRLLKEVA